MRNQKSGGIDINTASEAYLVHLEKTVSKKSWKDYERTVSTFITVLKRIYPEGSKELTLGTDEHEAAAEATAREVIYAKNGTTLKDTKTSTQNRKRAYLHAMYSFFQQERWIKTNPISVLRRKNPEDHNILRQMFFLR